MQAATAGAARVARPERTSAKTTVSRPAVATTSARRCGPEARCVVLTPASGSPNIALASTAPDRQPTTWVGTYAAASRQGSPPSAASARLTAGLMCAPLTGPSVVVIA